MGYKAQRYRGTITLPHFRVAEYQSIRMNHDKKASGARCHSGKDVLLWFLLSLQLYCRFYISILSDLSVQYFAAVHLSVQYRPTDFND